MSPEPPDRELSQIIEELKDDIPTFLENPQFTRDELGFIYAMNGVINHGEEYFQNSPTRLVPYPQAPRGNAVVKLVLFITAFLILVVWLPLASFWLLVHVVVGGAWEGEGKFGVFV